MNDSNEKKVYLQIGAGRLLNIRVIIDDKLEPEYEGMVEDAPPEIKKLKYSKVDMGDPITYYVYTELQ